MGNKILNIILFAILIIAVLYIGFNFMTAKPVNTSGSGVVNIGSRDKAIEFAKQDKDFSDNEKSLAKMGKVGYNAYFDSEKNYWRASVAPEQVTDVGYYIYFYSNGSIIKKGQITIAGEV